VPEGHVRRAGTRKIVGAAELQMLISRDMNYKVLNAMQSTERSTKFPTEVECMLGKLVCRTGLR
jgi:hypothetical protein